MLLGELESLFFDTQVKLTIILDRISISYQTNAQRSPPLSWGTYIVGYLIMVCLCLTIYLVAIEDLLILYNTSAGVATCLPISCSVFRHQCYTLLGRGSTISLSTLYSRLYSPSSLLYVIDLRS